MLSLEFDEASGATFTDSSAFGNVATASAGGVVAGAVGHTNLAVGFVGGVVTIPAPTRIPDSPHIWIEAWTQPALPLTGTQTLVTRVGSYTLSQVDADLVFEVIPLTTGTPCTASSSGSRLVAGNWQHVAAWYDGMTVMVALNGAIVGTAACPSGPITPTPAAAVHVGGIPATSGVTAPFAGRIDELRIRQNAAQAYNPSPSYSVRGDLTYNEVVSRVMGATPGSYTGRITATANGRNYYGRAATTVICQAAYGPGARMCDLYDLMRLMQANAIRPVSPDAPADVPSTASSLPTVNTWINASQIRVYSGSGTSNQYNDCFNWSGSSVANGAYGAMYYVPPSSSWPFGYTEPANCNASFPLMCCK